MMIQYTTTDGAAHAVQANQVLEVSGITDQQREIDSSFFHPDAQSQLFMKGFSVAIQILEKPSQVAVQDAQVNSLMALERIAESLESIIHHGLSVFIAEP